MKRQNSYGGKVDVLIWRRSLWRSPASLWGSIVQINSVKFLCTGAQQVDNGSDASCSSLRKRLPGNSSSLTIRIGTTARAVVSPCVKKMPPWEKAKDRVRTLPPRPSCLHAVSQRENGWSPIGGSRQEAVHLGGGETKDAPSAIRRAERRTSDVMRHGETATAGPLHIREMNSV